MGGPGSGLNRGSENGAIISALDEARWHLIEAEENERKQVERLGRAYAYAKEANLKVAAAIAELTRLQHNLGDTELTDRESQRVDELTSSHPTRLSMLHDAIVATAKENGNAHLAPLKAAVKKAATA